MRYVLFILLGLSLPAMAVDAGKTDAGKTLATQPIPKGVVVAPPCDPEEELRMPDFN